MAEHGRAPRGSPGWAPAVGRRIAKNAAANAALLSPITGKSAQTLLYDDTMAASTLHAAAAVAKDKTKGKKAAGRLLMFAYVAAEALDDAEATSEAHAVARDAVDKLRMAVTNEDGHAASERAREAAAAALRAAGLEDEMRRRLKRARPGKFALVHQVLEYLYVGGWAALNDDCRVLREHKISRVCSVVTADTPRTLPAFVTHHLHVVCRDDENAPLTNAFPQISAFLDEARRAREIAYVHCGAGVSRACTSVAAYLIWSGSLSAGEALRIVQNRRPQCRPNAGFKRQLGAWAERCRGGEKPAICAAPTPSDRRRGTVVTVVRCDMSE